MELIDLVNSAIIFLSHMILLRWFSYKTFLLESLTLTHSPDLLDLFISSDIGICSTMAFHTLGNSDVVVSFPLTFQ